MKKMKMIKNKTKGLLFSFCGLDGCGKTTMINRLVKYFEEDNDIFLTKQPTDFVRKSDIFRTYMDCPNHDEYDYRSLSLLAASDRVQHSNKVIYSELEKGKIIFSDRYFYSCLANLIARGFNKDKWIYEISRCIVEPDVSFFLDVPVEIAVSRVKDRPEEKDRYIDIDLQYKLRQEYLKICKKNKGVLIDTQKSEDYCFEMIKNIIERSIENDC